MVIDAHAYCFPPLDSPAGYASLDEKMRHVQREFGGHHQPVWRVRDRAPADNSTLVDPDTGEPRELKWRRHLGRLVWDYEGETYTKQYVPPMLHNLEFPPETLIAEMDYAGVDKAVFHHSPHLGMLNSFLGEAVARYPSRFTRLIGVRDAEIPRDPDAAVSELEDEVRTGGWCGVQFFSRPYYAGGNEAPWDGGQMQPFWDAVASLKMPVYFTLQASEGRRYSSEERESYLDEHRTLLRWMERYPDLTVVLTHGLSWLSFQEGDRIRFPEQAWEVFKSPRCHLQLLFVIQMGGMWEYPWTQAETTVKECVERVGADRLIWGTDMPMVARFCTYRQALDQYRVHSDFLTENEREAITGGNAARIIALAAN